MINADTLNLLELGTFGLVLFGITWLHKETVKLAIRMLIEDFIDREKNVRSMIYESQTVAKAYQTKDDVKDDIKDNIQNLPNAPLDREKLLQEIIKEVRSNSAELSRLEETWMQLDHNKINKTSEKLFDDIKTDLPAGP